MLSSASLQSSRARDTQPKAAPNFKKQKIQVTRFRAIGAWLRRTRAGLLLLALVFTGFAATEPAHAAGAKKTKCDPVAGWAFVGRPANLSRLGAEGLYVWVDKSGGWRISATHGNRRIQRISGTITFDTPVVGKPTGSEGTFGELANPSANVVSFSFANYGGVDGISASAPCATAVSVNATIDEAPIGASQIFVGAAGLSPSSVPLTLARTSAGSGAQPGVSNVAASSAVVVPSAQPTAAPAGTTGSLAASPNTPSPAVAASPAAATALTTSPASASPQCSPGGWPSVLVGKPKNLSTKSAPTGVYLWVEKNVLKIQAVADGPQPSIVAGRISANGSVTVAGSGLEGKRDVVKADGSTVTFSLRVNRTSDGFEITSACATQFIIEATIDDVVAPLFLGANAAPIPAQPYLIAK